MNLFSFLSLAARRTRSSACDTLTRHWVRCVLCWLVFPSALVLRSTDSAAVPSPALFIGLIATLTKSDFLGSFIIGYGSLPSRRGPVMLTGQPQDLPVPKQGASAHARVLDHAGSQQHLR